MTERLHQLMLDETGAECDIETVDMVVNAAARIPEVREALNEAIEKFAALTE